MLLFILDKVAIHLNAFSDIAEFELYEPGSLNKTVRCHMGGGIFIVLFIPICFILLVYLLFECASPSSRWYAVFILVVSLSFSLPESFGNSLLGNLSFFSFFFVISAIPLLVFTYIIKSRVNKLKVSASNDT